RANDSGFDLSPDGSTVALTNNYEVLVLPAAGNRPPLTLAPFEAVRGVSLSADGTWATVTQPSSVLEQTIWNTKTGSVAGKVDTPGLFAKSGEWVANTRRRWTPPGWGEGPRLGMPKDLLPLAASPDGTALAFTKKEGVIHLVSPGDGRILARLESPD